jgi:hypothetical protein
LLLSFGLYAKTRNDRIFKNFEGLSANYLYFAMFHLVAFWTSDMLQATNLLNRVCSVSGVAVRPTDTISSDILDQQDETLPVWTSFCTVCPKSE